MVDDMTQQRFRVPRDDRSLLAIPRMDAVPKIVDENRSLFESSIVSLHGRPLSELRAATRRNALTVSRLFTSALIQKELPQVTSESVIATGHQPELFHVGVWAKNFALAAVARQCRSVAVNLIIDNDTINGTSLRIPAGNRESLHVDRVSFDLSRPIQPWEEATIRDREMFRQFGPLIRDRMRQTWGFDPLIGKAWTAAIRQSEVSDRLCDSLTALRVHAEREWGQNTLELPMSRLCETESFLWFAAHLLMRLPELHAIYNETVAEYRRLHRLRNRMQPVPDLESSDGWLEAPFWIWQQNSVQRGRLFARRSGSVCELRDEKTVFARLPLANYGPLDCAVSVLADLPARGFRLRTRALTTTLFARVCLTDLFVHGIGGAKYDAMTDQLCERLFGLKAPDFLTVSATLYLPLGGPFSATESRLRELNHQIRDLTYNPDRHLRTFVDAQALIDEKFDLLNTADKMRQSNQLQGKLTREQHRRLAQIRSELQALTGSIRADYESERTAIQAQLSANSLIRNREYSFVLHPEEQARQFLLPLSETFAAAPG